MFKIVLVFLSFFTYVYPYPPQLYLMGYGSGYGHAHNYGYVLNPAQNNQRKLQHGAGQFVKFPSPDYELNIKIPGASMMEKVTTYNYGEHSNRQIPPGHRPHHGYEYQPEYGHGQQYGHGHQNGNGHKYGHGHQSGHGHQAGHGNPHGNNCGHGKRGRGRGKPGRGNGRPHPRYPDYSEETEDCDYGSGEFPITSNESEVGDISTTPTVTKRPGKRPSGVTNTVPVPSTTAKIPSEAVDLSEGDPFAIDIRFTNNSTPAPKKTEERTKRSSNSIEEPTLPSFTQSNSLPQFYQPFWNFPFYPERSNSLATCVHKKYECIPKNKCKTSNSPSNQRFCRFSGDVPYVCCEKKEVSNRFLARQDVACGRKKSSGKSAAILGGVSVQGGNIYPWMTAIGEFDDNGEIDWFCGGALISAQTVVTAAHCLGRRSPDVVRIGEVDLTKERSSTMQEIFVWRQFTHPSYRPPAMYNDVALVYLHDPVQFNQFVRPVCLPKGTIDNAVAKLTGWGQLGFDGEKSTVLQEVALQVFNNSMCDKFYSLGTTVKRNFPRGILDTQMCAGDENGGKDACQGDSGSPLVTEEENNFVLSGIVSSGIGCGSKSFPGIYTRVSSFVPWILENIV